MAAAAVVVAPSFARSVENDLAVPQAPFLVKRSIKK